MANSFQNTSTLEKPKYGIDAPGVIRNLFAAGAICFGIGLLAPAQFDLGPLTISGHSLLWAAGFMLGEASLMLWYALRGKYGHRDRMLALHDWRGDEQVLDIGTGGGLLLIAAAHRLDSGHAVGSDIWNKHDLSGNTAERTQRNLSLEGLTDRCTLVSESAQQMSFAAGTFDVILSNLCLHNIPDASSRKSACAEIARVLRPGGVAIISDYKCTSEYAREFRSAGLAVERRAADWLRTFPALRIVVARKQLIAA
jgi:arsenite methyltransferase